MLPRAFRLKRSALFKTTLEKGTKLYASPDFSIIGLPRKYVSDTPTRFGFIVSKKVSNRANQRNKVKRRLREMVRTYLQSSQAEVFKPYTAIVVIARPHAKEASYQELAGYLRESVKKR